ncbi:MAG: glycoside hydrolase family 30 protein [Candidatus Nanopelagicales bacterium]
MTTARAWMTCADRSRLLTPVGAGIFARTAPSRDAPEIIVGQTARQAVDGFGLALTGGSAELLMALPSSRRAELFEDLFTPAGAGLSMLRLSVGASDLSSRAFTYLDLPLGDADPDLSRFDLLADDQGVLEVLPEILEYQPELQLLGSPWSAPAWMKDNSSLIGGALRREHMETYSRYLARYVSEMADRGIAIHSLTLQNEPGNALNEPSMTMNPQEQAALATALSAQLAGTGHKVRLYCWDHNADQPEYVHGVYADLAAREAFTGSAWHLYAGEIETLSEIHQAYPDKEIYFTEQWVGGNASFAEQFMWLTTEVLIGSLRNWAKAVVLWNLASDPQFNPRTPGGCDQCRGALTIEARSQSVTRNEAYYVLAHAARFVPPGSERLESTAGPAGTANVVLRTPGGEIYLIIANNRDSRVELSITCAGQRWTLSQPPGSVTTCLLA